MNMIPSKKETAVTAVDGGSNAADLTTLIRTELGFVRESFHKAKQNMDQLITQTDQAFDRFQELLLPPEIGGARVTDLRLLLESVSKLKSRIPFNLIIPTSDDYRFSDPNLHFRPRSTISHPRTVNISVPNQINVANFDHPPTSELLELKSSVPTLSDELKDCLMCFLVFPKNVIIKRSLMFYWVKAHCSDDFNDVIKLFIAKKFVNSVYKEGNLGVSGYWMHPLVRSTLNDRNLIQRPRPPIHPYLVCNVDDDDMGEDIIYPHPEKFLPEKGMRFLHLGKWQRTSSQQHVAGQFEQHIEVFDHEHEHERELFFKGMENLHELRYVSLGGVSMITELPDFITKLKRLEFLDLKACYNLEVIPPDIANLSRSLTHLDMSECFFVDDMPMALASLRFLKVLKGFFVGNTKKDSCRLHHLLPLRFLEKLNIYTSVKEFPSEEQLTTLQEFKALRKLTISWGGCSILSETDMSRLAVIAATRHRGFLKRMGTNVGRDKVFSFALEKLDLQCVPEMVTRSWLNPSNFRDLKKLYIRGGPFYDLGQFWDDQESEEPVLMEDYHWNVEILRLKHLSKLEIDWSELEHLFPNLICAEKVKCPNLNGFPRDDDGFFMKGT